MDTDDIAPPPKRPTGPANLEAMGLEELANYISTLEDEIERAKVMIESKKAALSGAASLFKS